jgi:hypothetical protein
MKRERPRARAGRIPPHAPDRETGSCAHGCASRREGAHVRGRDHDRDDADRGCGLPHVSADARPRALDCVCGRVRLPCAHAHAARDRGPAADYFCVRVCVHPPFGVLSLLGWLDPAPQASAETPVPSRHEHSACKLYSETAKSSGKVAQA